MTAIRLRLCAQAFAALAALAWAPAEWLKAMLLAAIWLLPHRKLSRREWALFVGANALFVVMDGSAVRGGLFAFSHPSAFGIAAYEPVMWGGYLLHVRRFWAPEAHGAARLPASRFVALAVLAAAFAASFSVVRDARTLFVVTTLIVIVAASVSRTRLPIACALHMVALGAAVECVGVASGEWSYPREAPLTLPLWFAPMWSGVGLFFASLVFPFVTTRSQPKGDPNVEEGVPMAPVCAPTSRGPQPRHG